ncbi:MAG: c-type cytochrome biogenesis protein CcsB [Cellulomonas sp. 73-145]|uniref:c-type cytochrome biogenesis protein CcsB n=1 Tax=Cellulomonas sp. 73-145 TaxID=1895739 RepID=UPI0009282A3F|nr:c-type cytochrome biogenesis protein CcsB [Cellulomonas sp. 73-145]MBN9326637.1 c-type cytochrome biogenesis protein CcsB [Cellulomonas sp.]OJV60390.1 MAG: c-type cytochrome biogenesis protein CcsB [Cellulomonas sp. 73-145]
MTTGDLSTLLVWAATTAFTIAWIAYTVDLAGIVEAGQRRAGQRRASTSRARAVPAGVAVTAGAPVAVGAAGLVSGASADAVRPATVAAGGPDDNRVTAAADGGAADGPDGRSARSEGIARSTTYLGTALLIAGIVMRGVAAGRWPTANMYEFTLVGVLVASVVLTLVQRRRVIAFVGVVVLGITVLALAADLLLFYVKAEAVQPALQSYWLVIHVGVAISATGVFTVAFAASALQLLSAAREEGRSHLTGSWGAADGLRRPLAGWRVTGPRFAWLKQVPGPRNLEALSFRLNAVGFVLWTFTLIGGAIWAEHAWGRYWNWDPKEIGTFVAWVVYAAYLHARTTRGWNGRRAAYLVFAGYAVVIANFTLVNLFVSGLHSYSGLK